MFVSVFVVAGVEEHAAPGRAAEARSSNNAYYNGAAEARSSNAYRTKREDVKKRQKTSEHVDKYVVAEAQFCIACRRVVGCGADR